MESFHSMNSKYLVFTIYYLGLKIGGVDQINHQFSTPQTAATFVAT